MLILEGEVNFRTLSIIAQGALVLLAVFLYKQLATINYKTVVLLGICLVIFQPRSYDLMIWPMAGFAYFSLYAYWLASLYFLSRNTPLFFIVSFCFAVLCTFTLAPGQLIWAAGLGFLAYSRLTGRARGNAYLILWALLSVAVLSAYHINYTTPWSAVAMVESALNSPVYTVRFCIALLGNGFSFDNVFASQLLGTFALFALGWLSFHGFKTGLSSLRFYSWFVVLTIWSLGIARAPAATLELFNIPPPLLEYTQSPHYGFALMVLLATLFTL